MLTRIKQLVVEDIRIWKGRHVFDFNQNCTVIHGDNGKGKSTLAMVMMLTLTIMTATSLMMKPVLIKKN